MMIRFSSPGNLTLKFGRLDGLEISEKIGLKNVCIKLNQHYYFIFAVYVNI